MRAFEDSLAFTLRWEGIWSNDPDDPGGETFRGIARKKHPDWSGWALVDALADKRREYPPELELAVRAFYRYEFWDKIGGDQIARVAPKLALALFDFAVNSGIGTALQMLQGFTGASPDGVFGTKTLASAQEYMDRMIAFELLERREAFLKNWIGQKAVREKFRNGLMNRISDIRLLIS